MISEVVATASFFCFLLFPFGSLFSTELQSAWFVQDWTLWTGNPTGNCFESIKNVDRTKTFFPLVIDIQKLQDSAREKNVDIIWTERLKMEKYLNETSKPPLTVVLWMWFFGEKDYFPTILQTWPETKLIFFLYESHSTCPYYFDKQYHSFFHKIYTWDDDLIDNNKYFKFYYPVLESMAKDIPSFEEKRLCTLICSNKTTLHPHELYSARKEVIQFFEDQPGNDFEFFGHDWSGYRTYRGLSMNKIETLKNYRFVYCYENISSAKGYITEKIFDCFAAGTIPIYWGATNIEEYIPKECFIDRRNFSSNEELYAFIKKMPKEEFEAYIRNIKEFLSSETAQLFSSDHFIETFIEAGGPNFTNLERFAIEKFLLA